jgi:photosystem II stability/assembly factor-like uncharacterized protein
MAIWTRSALAAGLALLAAACGTATSGPAAHAKATPARAAAPAVTVTPDTALTGGQPLRVRMTGFPPNSTIELYECVAPVACDAAAASYAGTGSAGGASATFIAQPSVLTGSSSTPVRCDRQCVLVAVVIKEPGGPPAQPAPAATARLTFATASPATDLAYSSLQDTSWVSAAEGWALAARPCSTGTCTRMARTTDAGRHWQELPGPPARIQDGTADCAAQACVTHVSFASPAIGYLWGPGLLMTTDGGLTWHAQPGPWTETLTIAGGQAYRVTYTSGGCPGPCRPSLQEAPAGSASWRTLIGALAEPGRSGSAQIVASGPHVLIAMYGSLAGPVPAQAVVYRSANGGGTWQQAADPCAGPGRGGPGQEEDLIGLAAAPGGFFAGLCVQRNSIRTFVITSADAGAAWRPAAAPPPGQWLGVVAAASPATIAVASGATGGNGTDTAQLLVTTDGGRHWVTAATDTQNLAAGSAPAWLGFETPLAGQWLGDPHGVWTTTDGGLHWTRTAFR